MKSVRSILLLLTVEDTHLDSLFLVGLHAL